MTRGRLRAAIGWASTVLLLACFATFLWALVSDRTRRIPGVFEVRVVQADDAAGVDLVIGPGLLPALAALTGLAIVLQARLATRRRP